ncbi:TetR family transcriptional regulator C-terminal domain-containing protein [Marilutibacter maris]|nr:TetR family transcriptional regulator C-terminal domain-containing protein [Lysobacter maris]
MLNIIEQSLNSSQWTMEATMSAGARGRERILEAATQVLMEQGLLAATTRAVTGLAGVGAGLLNHYFRWPELRATAWTAIFDQVLPLQFGGHDDPRAAMSHYLEQAFSADEHVFWRLWSEAVDLARSDAEMARALAATQQRAQADLTRVLAAGCREGAWTLVDAQATALRLGALYDGLAGLLISGATAMTGADARGHLRAAFELECRAGA